MMYSATLLPLVLAAAGMVNAGFDANANNNIAIYWGQNSVNRPTGQSGAQERLSYYCQNTSLNIIPLAFLHVIVNPTSVNFANAGDRCTTFPGTTLLSCPEIEADIKTCQSLGKTILLSIGGATYTEGGFPSSAAAGTAAENLWSIFGPVVAGSTVNRPFGTAVVDGFDLDFEAGGMNNLLPFARRLRQLMDAGATASARKFYLSAAPQCVWPDAAMDAALSSDVAFDFVMVQFYNNWCGLQNFQPGAATQTAFNLDRWDTWARADGRKTKVLVGAPGAPGAAGSGYTPPATLDTIIKYAKQFPSFGGVMFWDASQVWVNTGFLDSVTGSLGGGNTGGTQPPAQTTTTSTSTAAPTTSTSISSSVPACPTPPAATTTVPATTTTAVPSTTPAAPGGSLVPQWGQCGGNGYTGSTTCQSPYKCVYSSAWWSMCQ